MNVVAQFLYSVPSCRFLGDCVACFFAAQAELTRYTSDRESLKWNG